MSVLSPKRGVYVEYTFCITLVVSSMEDFVPQDCFIRRPHPTDKGLLPCTFVNSNYCKVLIFLYSCRPGITT